MIIDCISDMHGSYPKLEGGDLLIIAGDLTARDEHEQLIEFRDWLRLQNYKKKVVVSGNHDKRLETTKDLMMCHVYCHSADYLEDSGTQFEGLKIWGSPHTKVLARWHPQVKAFGCDTNEELKKYWDMIPEDIDILITHGPALGILDETELEDRCGCPYLYKQIQKIQPKLHICGHIHEGYGIDYLNKTLCVNAAIMNVDYEPVNKPIRVIIDGSHEAKVI